MSPVQYRVQSLVAA
ncbi:hypothetical protein [Bacillus cereus group sp. BfR-BA-01312]